MTASVEQTRPAGPAAPEPVVPVIEPARRSPRIPGPRAARPLIRLACLAPADDPADGGPPFIRWLAGVQPSDWPDYAPEDVELRGVELADVEFADVELADASFPDAELADVELSDVELSDVELSDAGFDADVEASTPVLPELEPPSATRRSSPRRRWLIAGLATAAVIEFAVAGVLVSRAVHRAPSATTSVAPSPAAAADQTAAAATWALASLDPRGRLVTDPVTGSALIGRGFPTAAVIEAGQQPLPSGARFLLSTRQLRAIATSGQDPALARLFGASQPIAAFGTGAGLVEVREVVPAGVTAASEAGSRQLAGQALLGNHAVTVSPAATNAFSTGRLDLRAATLIAAVAAQTPVRVVDVVQQPAEVGAGIPIRAVRLAVAGNPAVLRMMIAALPASYRPLRAVRQSDGSYVVTWAPELLVTPPIS